jgi:hypothetical protein
MSTKKKILIGVVVFVLLLGIGGLVAFMGSSKERKLASQFVADLSQGNVSAAYGQFSPKLKDVQSQDIFESQVATLELDSSCKLKTTGVTASSSTDDGKQTTVDGKVECGNDKTFNTAKFIYDANSQLYGYSIKP